MKKMNMKSLISTALTMASAVCLLSCSGETEEPEELIRPVRYERVHYSKGERSRTFSGISKSGTHTKLSFRVSGIIQAINVIVGKEIKEGQPVASLDDADAQLMHEEAKAEMHNAQVQMEIAGSNLNRIRDLYENDNVSLNEYEEAKNKYSAARSAYEISIKRLNLEKRQLSYYRLSAPIDGIVAVVQKEENENVQAGEVIVELSSVDDIEINVGMPEAYISYLDTGARVQVCFSSIPKEHFEGIVSEVSYISSESSTYPVTIKIRNATKRIRPGMPSDVTFNFQSDESEKQLFVSRSTVSEDTTGNFVFVVVEGDEKGFAIVHKRAVQVGRLTDDGFEILKGLKEGELVVSSGIANITEGLKVRFLDGTYNP